MEQGQGLGQLIPPLAQSDYLIAHHGDLACIIRNGLEGEIVVNGKSYNQPMAGISEEEISDVEMTNIINYISNNWGNELGSTTLKAVQQQLDNCKEKN